MIDDNNMPPELDDQSPQKFSGRTVREIHVDFLLEEEFRANPKFLRNFIEAADQHDIPVEIERVEHSVSDQYGEADLIVVYRRLGGSEERIAILIEDKIRAIF